MLVSSRPRAAAAHLIVLPLLAASALAQQPATKQATADFLKTKSSISYEWRDGDKVVGVKTELSVNVSECQMHYTRSRWKDSVLGSEIQTHISLADINPNSIDTGAVRKTPYALLYGYDVPATFVVFATTQRKKTLLRTVTDFKDGTASNPREIQASSDYLLASDGEDATRAARALKHLVKLCGGKDELF